MKCLLCNDACSNNSNYCLIHNPYRKYEKTIYGLGVSPKKDDLEKLKLQRKVFELELEVKKLKNLVNKI